MKQQSPPYIYPVAFFIVIIAYWAALGWLDLAIIIGGALVQAVITVMLAAFLGCLLEALYGAFIYLMVKAKRSDRR